jgi:hypothetical protein
VIVPGLVIVELLVTQELTAGLEEGEEFEVPVLDLWVRPRRSIGYADLRVEQKELLPEHSRMLQGRVLLEGSLPLGKASVLWPYVCCASPSAIALVFRPSSCP